MPTLPTRFQKGITFAAFSRNKYNQGGTDWSLARLAATGADWVSLVATAYQNSLTDTSIEFDTYGPTDGELIRVIHKAKDLGLKVMLKPHVDIYNSDDWRGEIAFGNEDDWTAWFHSYRTFIGHYAALAATHEVDQFCVGTELAGTTAREDDWREVVKAVRAEFPKPNPITYAANWGGEEKAIRWWDELNFIGVDAYYPLTDEIRPGVEKLIDAWQPHIDILDQIYTEYCLPILCTEIGYRSVEGANRRPHFWNSDGSEVEQLDLVEQRDAYQAAFEVLSDQPWFAGSFWWMWGTDPLHGGAYDIDYTPLDKPAEQVLSHWYGGRSRRPAKLQPDHANVFVVYDDHVASGWSDASWNANHQLDATDQVHHGFKSISATLEPWGAISFSAEAAFDVSDFMWLELYVRLSRDEPLWLSVYEPGDGFLGEQAIIHPRYTGGAPIQPGTWTQIQLPLHDLDALGKKISRITLQNYHASESTEKFWVDDIAFVGAQRL